MAQQQRTRKYDDELQCYDYAPPDNAPSWAYVEQPDMIYDTEFSYSEKTAEDEEEDDYFEAEESEELSVVIDSMNIASRSGSFMQEE